MEATEQGSQAGNHLPKCGCACPWIRRRCPLCRRRASRPRDGVKRRRRRSRRKRIPAFIAISLNWLQEACGANARADRERRRGMGTPIANVVAAAQRRLLRGRQRPTAGPRRPRRGSGARAVSDIRAPSASRTERSAR
eukprot:1082367-Pyramimonas_sp.AAC.1